LRVSGSLFPLYVVFRFFSSETGLPFFLYSFRDFVSLRCQQFHSTRGYTSHRLLGSLKPLFSVKLGPTLLPEGVLHSFLYTPGDPSTWVFVSPFDFLPRWKLLVFKPPPPHLVFFSSQQIFVLQARFPVIFGIGMPCLGLRAR